MEEQVKLTLPFTVLPWFRAVTNSNLVLSGRWFYFPSVAVISSVVTLSLVTFSFFELQFSYQDALH